MRLDFFVNGEAVSLDVDPQRRLLDILREDLGLTGTKEGCSEGECGACTVLVEGEAVHSCLTLAAQLTGIVRGMLPAGIPVTAGMKAGDIDPRCEVRHCFTVSDKARAIGGGVLEGILYFGRRLRLWND